MTSFRARLHASVVGSVSFSLLLASMPTSAAADPTDGTVVAGAATITQTPGTTVITQTSQRAIIDWRSFNIAENETARFDQPNSSAIALNRITGGAPTSIQGSLLANGQVWLINPNGIAFGRSARVDVAGLIATTLDIDNRDFMAGRYTFTGSADGRGTITNAGHITIKDAGLAALVAPGVENSGIIEAHYGRVTLGSTTGFAVDFYGDGLTRFLAGDRLSRVLGSTGNDTGRVAITASAAKAIVDRSVNLDGVSEATGLSVAGGAITLTGPATGYVSVSGTLDTSGPKGSGGAIDVAAANVSLTSAAILNASGSSHGGAVRVGGDWHGQGELPTATTTTIEDGALIRVDAAQGDAGSAVVWSDNQTRFDGTILATGGTSGGSVEVSGKRLLDYTGTTDLRAATGAMGSLLLDPENVTISATGSSPTLPASGATSFQPSADDSILSVAALQNALALGNVTVTTGSTGTQAGDITVASSISWSSGNALSLEAFRNITVGDGVTIANTGAGNLSLRADSTGTGIGTVTFTGAGKVNYTSSTGLVSIYYNSSDNPANSKFNLQSYTHPSDYLPDVLLSSTNSLKSYMLVNSIYDLQNVENNLSATYALGGDIDATATSSASWSNQPGSTLGQGFYPIGGLSGYFSGTLNGDGRTINNLTIDPHGSGNLYGWEYGIFGSVSASGSIQNLKITNLTISANTQGSAGGIYIGGIAGFSQGLISNVSVQGNIMVAGVLENSPNGFTYLDVGGLVGDGSAGNGNSATTILGSSASINIKSYITVAQDVTAEPIIGGIVGVGATINNSYAVGSIVVTGSNRAAIGGAVGSGSYGLDGVYAAVSLTLAADVQNGVQGGLDSQNSPVQNSYWDVSVSGTSTSANGVGLTTIQLKSRLPDGFDPTIWGIDSSINNGYPYLKAQASTLTSTPTLVAFGTGVASPPPPPPPSSLTVGSFGTSFTTSTAPYQPTIVISGSGLSSVSEIRLTWTDPSGQTGTVIWNAANNFGGGRFVVANDTSATISPVLVAANDPSGSYQWTVEFMAGTQTASRSFTVSYAPAVTPPPSTFISKTGIDQIIRSPGDQIYVIPTPEDPSLVVDRLLAWIGISSSDAGWDVLKYVTSDALNITVRAFVSNGATRTEAIQDFERLFETSITKNNWKSVIGPNARDAAIDTFISLFSYHVVGPAIAAKIPSNPFAAELASDMTYMLLENASIFFKDKGNIPTTLVDVAFADGTPIVQAISGLVSDNITNFNNAVTIIQNQIAQADALANAAREADDTGTKDHYLQIRVSLGTKLANLIQKHELLYGIQN